ANFLTAQPFGQRWRLTLASPARTRQPVTLRFTCEVPRRGDDMWQIPLLSVLGITGKVEGETILHVADSDGLRLEAVGMAEVRAAGPQPGRIFLHTSGPMALTLRGALLDTRVAPGGSVRHAILTTQVLPDHLVNSFRFQTANLRGPTVSLTLPPGAQLRAVRVDGKAVQIVATENSGGGLTVSLPAGEPAIRDASGGLGRHAYELLYEQPLSAGWLWDRLDAPVPILSDQSVNVRRIWRLPPGRLPFFEHRLTRLPGPAVESTSIGGLLSPSVLTRAWEARQRLALNDAATALRRGQEGQS